MKKSYQIIILFSILFTSLWSCKKDEKQIYLEGGTAPVLRSSVSDSIPGSLANQNERAVTLSWSNPEYKFTTGPSSQNVTYNIEIDTAGAKFSSSKKKSISVLRELSYTLSQKELNTILYSDLELPLNVKRNIEVRITASLGTNNAAALVSNILAFAVTTYYDPALVPPDLFITGSATPSDWTNSPPTTQKFTYIGNKTYEIIMTFAPGKEYKLLTSPGNWQPQYGSAEDGVTAPGTLQVNDGTSTDPPAIKTPTVAGDYKITVNMANRTFTVVKQ